MEIGEIQKCIEESKKDGKSGLTDDEEDNGDEDLFKINKNISMPL